MCSISIEPAGPIVWDSLAGPRWGRATLGAAKASSSAELKILDSAAFGAFLAGFLFRFGRANPVISQQASWSPETRSPETTLRAQPTGFLISSSFHAQRRDSKATR